jgi:hypothetical protein
MCANIENYQKMRVGLFIFSARKYVLWNEIYNEQRIKWSVIIFFLFIDIPHVYRNNSVEPSGAPTLRTALYLFFICPFLTLVHWKSNNILHHKVNGARIIYNRKAYLQRWLPLLKIKIWNDLIYRKKVYGH